MKDVVVIVLFLLFTMYECGALVYDWWRYRHGERWAIREIIKDMAFIVAATVYINMKY
jgi:hypothetical protein